LELVKSAELFAKKKHSGMTQKDGSDYSKHLESVVNRLKSLGVIDKELLCTGWLHDTIEDTETSFDDLYEQFGSRVAVLVSSLSKDTSLSKKKKEQAYLKQLKESSFDAKLIKLCDISANLSDLKTYSPSKSKQLKYLKLKRRNLIAIKKDLIENSDYPKIVTLLESINKILKRYDQRPISLQ
jgi:guanosine-3',5'-bis(diphosphate) 3'-pyrophosphohydrolase